MTGDMTGQMVRQRMSGLASRVSGGMLLLGIMAVAALAALVLSVSVLRDSAEAETARLERMAARMTAALEEGGLAGLSVRIDALADDLAGDAAGDGALRHVAVWRLRGPDRVLHREAPHGMADILSAVTPGAMEVLQRPDGDLLALSVDLRAASAGWTIPMADVALTVAQPFPGPERRAARRLVAAVWAGLGLALLSGLALHLNHGRRYRLGLREINARLERVAAGEAGVRMPAGSPAPELRELAAKLDVVLPRLDELVTGLRDLSASLAHELRTPLQRIRSDLSRLLVADDAASRQAHGASINTTIDRTDARIHNLMQLFRLEAGAEITQHPQTDLRQIVENAVDDLIDLLETRDRQVSVTLAQDVRVAGNGHLLDLMLGNLLGNAAKYASPGGAITVQLSRANCGFCLTLANDGGLPAEIRNIAPRRFARGRDAADAGGMGIGLSLVQAIALRHGFALVLGGTADRTEITITGPLSHPVAAQGDRP